MLSKKSYGQVVKGLERIRKHHDETIEETKRELRETAARRGDTFQMIEHYIANADWLKTPAWPYAEKDEVTNAGTDAAVP